MNQQRKICAFYEYHRYKQEQNQKDTIYHIQMEFVILDGKLYDKAIQEIISDISKVEKLNEIPTLKRETSLQHFLHKLKQKTFFNKNEYDKL